MPVFDTEQDPPQWDQKFTGRCDWWIDVGGGGVACLLPLGHDGPGPGPATLPSRPRWHRTWGETWLHAWSEDDADAYRRNQG